MLGSLSSPIKTSSTLVIFPNIFSRHILYLWIPLFPDFQPSVWFCYMGHFFLSQSQINGDFTESELVIFLPWECLCEFYFYYISFSCFFFFLLETILIYKSSFWIYATIHGIASSLFFPLIITHLFHFHIYLCCLSTSHISIHYIFSLLIISLVKL